MSFPMSAHEEVLAGPTIENRVQKAVFLCVLKRYVLQSMCLIFLCIDVPLLDLSARKPDPTPIRVTRVHLNILLATALVPPLPPR